MANDTKRYLEGLARRKADRYFAKVAARKPNNEYEVKRIDSEATTIARANAGDVHKIGSWVEVLSSSASGNVIGGKDVIVTRAPQRGMSETTPAKREEITVKPVVLKVDPYPLELEAGGEAGEQEIIGRGLTTAAEYVEHGDGDPPNITEEDAPVITATKVTMSISADADSPLGEFDLVINNIRVKNALRVEELPLAPVTLWVSTWGSPKKMLQVDPADLAVLATHELTGIDGAVGLIIDTVVAVATNVLSEWDRHTSERLPDVPIGPITARPFAVGSHGDKLWDCYDDGTPQIRVRSIDVAGVIETFAIVAAAGNTCHGVAVNGAILYMTMASATRLVRFDTGTETGSVIIYPTGLRGCCMHAGALYVSGQAGGTTNYAYRADPDTGISDASIAVMLGGGSGYVVSDSDKLFLVSNDFNIAGDPAVVYLLADDLTDATKVAEIDSVGEITFAVAGGGAIYISTDSGTLVRVTSDDYTVTTAAIDPDLAGIGESLLA